MWIEISLHLSLILLVDIDPLVLALLAGGAGEVSAAEVIWELPVSFNLANGEPGFTLIP